MIETETSYINTYGLLVAGLIMILVFGWMIRKEMSSFKSYSNNKFDKFVFFLDNINIIGAFCFGILLIIIAIFG